MYATESPEPDHAGCRGLVRLGIFSHHLLTAGPRQIASVWVDVQDRPYHVRVFVQSAWCELPLAFEMDLEVGELAGGMVDLARLMPILEESLAEEYLRFSKVFFNQLTVQHFHEIGLGPLYCWRAGADRVARLFQCVAQALRF